MEQLAQRLQNNIELINKIAETGENVDTSSIESMLAMFELELKKVANSVGINTVDALKVVQDYKKDVNIQNSQAIYTLLKDNMQETTAKFRRLPGGSMYKKHLETVIKQYVN
ncbi:MAG: hypothetical protein ATN35_11375 [Epulopiscium sp. Nele67-Bin004]|nr:MAG: hypothetical protein ATN35_11375 [Epulopiscium sp. Nele67-Bin004]